MSEMSQSEVGSWKDGKMEQSSADASAQQQVWLVTADPKQYDWDIAFKAGTVRWTEARGPEAQKNIRATRPGDVVLAYRSTPDQYIAGLGHVAGIPYQVGAGDEQRYAVQIDMDLRLDEGVYLDDLRKAVPDLQHVSRRRPVSFSPVEPRQWAVIRELILERNRKLAPNDLPPAIPVSTGMRSAPKGILVGVPRPPVELWPGELLVLSPVEVTNGGIEPWPTEGDYAVTLSYHISTPDGQLAPVVNRWPLPRSVPAVETASFDVPLTAPLDAGEYRIEWWLEYRTPSSDYVRLKDSSVGPYPFRVITSDEAKGRVARLLTPGAMPAEERRSEMERIGRVVGADTDPDLRRFLVEEALLPALFDADWPVGRAALQALFTIRQDYKGLEERLRATLRDQPDERAAAEALADRPIGDELEKWLRGLLPAYGVRILDAEVPDSIRAGDRLLPSLRVQNTGDVPWTADEALTVLWRWWPRGKGRRGTPAHHWEWTREPGEPIPPGGEATFEVDLTVPDVTGTYNTEWSVSGQAWGETVRAARREGSVVVWPAVLPLDALFASDSQAALAALRTLYERAHSGPGADDVERQVAEALADRRGELDRVAAWAADATLEAPVRQWLVSLYPPHAYWIEIDRAEWPDPLPAGSTCAPLLHLRNQGDLSWQAGDLLSVALDWQGADEAAPALPTVPWDKVPLAERTAPGQAVALTLSAIDVPAQPGAYVTRWTARGVSWQASAERLATVAVAAAPSRAGAGAPAGAKPTEGAPAGVAPAGTATVGTAAAGETPAGAAPGGPTAIVLPVAAVQFEPPPAEHTVTVTIAPDIVTLTWGGQTFASPNEIRPHELEEARSRPPLTYGQLLFEGILNPHRADSRDSTYDGYILARARARSRLRLELRVDDPAVPDCQWEYMRNPNEVTVDNRPAPPLAVYADAPFYRRYDNGRQYAPVEARPLRILVAMCNPVTLRTKIYPDGKKVPPHIAALSELDIDQELGIIRPGLERLRTDGIATYRILESVHGEPVTFEAVAQELQEGYHVLHLLAHGLFLNGTYQLVMEDEHRLHRLVPASRFEAPHWSTLRLVVLAACQSAARNVQGSLALPGLGQLLVRRGVQAAIAMQDAIDVEAAQLFARRFYDDLARTGRIDMAMAATRYDLYQDRPDRWDWGIPVLFMSSQEGRLFAVDQRLERRAAVDRPTLADLRAQVKPYGELPGGGDPTARVVMDAVQAQVQAAYDNPALLSALRAVIAPSAARIGADRPLPLAREQDRAALDRLTHRVDLDAPGLAGFVQARMHMEIPMVVYQQVCSALNAGKHLVLTGPPGCGKTNLAQAICQYAHEQGHYTGGMAMTTATADWTTFDTIGGYVPTEQGTLEFRPGILLEAVAEGRWLVIDEINRAEIDKAFGELFTVLSGQGVDLPYSVQRQPVRILAASEPEDPDHPAPLFWARLATSGYDYVVPPSWRIVGTMNVYDKSYLYNMSFAFMRRFAFVDVDLPERALYHSLLERWFDQGGLPLQANPANDPPGMQAMRGTLRELIRRDNALMRRRALGPGIIKDAVAYIGDRYRKGGQREDELLTYLGEAFQLYIAPQLDGLDHEGILDVYACVDRLFESLAASGAGGRPMRDTILQRIELLYPHIQPDDWAGKLSQTRQAQPQAGGT